MKRAARFLFATMALLVAFSAQAQPDLSRRTGVTVADTGAPGWRFEQFRVASADGQRRYRIRVAVPLRAPPPAGFPVAYLLDGNAALMETDATLLAELSAAPRPPLIAYIAHDNDLRIDADARAYDYTPRRPGGDEAQRDAMGNRRTGGADDFLALIERDVVPKVEALAKADPSRRALWGHSYGGVFALHALFSRPDAFSVYAAADPSLWWGDGYLLEEEKRARRIQGASPTLWLMVGEGARAQTHAPPPGRDPQAVAAMQRARRSAPPDAAPKLAERLRQAGIQVEYRPLPGLSHGRTLGASLPLLLRWLAEAPAR